MNDLTEFDHVNLVERGKSCPGRMIRLQADINNSVEPIQLLHTQQFRTATNQGYRTVKLIQEVLAQAAFLFRSLAGLLVSLKVFVI